MAWFPMYARDWLSSASVGVMNAAERGMYVMLLCHAWLADEPGVLPDDDEVLAALARVTLDEWRLSAKRVRRAFYESSRDGRPVLVQRRMREVSTSSQEVHERLSRAGRAGNEKRWSGKKMDRHAIAPRLKGESPGDPKAIAYPQAQTQESSSEEVRDAVTPPLSPPQQQIFAQARGEAASLSVLVGPSPETEKQSQRRAWLREWDSAFSEFFWPQYPRKVAQQASRRAWARVGAEAVGRPAQTIEGLESLLGAIVDGLAWYLGGQWKDRERDKIPHAATWLNQRRWEDAP